MSLQAYLYDYLNNCDSLRALVDDTNGIRRMDRPSKGTYRTCVCIGNIINGTVPGAERRPFLNQSPAISIWVRPELEEMGDMTLQAILIELMKRLVWVGDDGFPAQDCVGAEPPILVYASEFVGADVPPYFDESYQSWTTRFRIRFLVGFATCLPVADDCSPCIPIPAGDVEDDDENDDDDGPTLVGEGFIPPEEPLLAGTAYSQVQPGQEAGVDDHDLYIVNHDINTTTFEANKKPGSIAIAYITTSLILRLPVSAWYSGLRAATAEADYWHIGGASEANRLTDSDYPQVWHVRPSVSLANRLADFVITNIRPYWDGTFVDESQGELPNGYLNDYRMADEWIEANLPAVQTDWRAMQTQFVFRLKQAFGENRAVVANTAGKTRPEVDGIMIESSHVVANGVPWAMARFEEQKEFWQENENRFLHPNPEIASVLNIKHGPTLDPVFSIPGLVWPGTTTDNP